MTFQRCNAWRLNSLSAAKVHFQNASMQSQSDFMSCTGQQNNSPNASITEICEQVTGAKQNTLQDVSKDDNLTCQNSFSIHLHISRAMQTHGHRSFQSCHSVPRQNHTTRKGEERSKYDVMIVSAICGTGL